MTQENERERIARALYLIDGTERQQTSRAAFWDKGGEPANATKHDWLGQADRLLEVLGSPVVEQQPVRWLMNPTNGTERVRKTAPDALEMAAYAKIGWTVTPLYAGAQMISPDNGSGENG